MRVSEKTTRVSRRWISSAQHHAGFALLVVGLVVLVLGSVRWASWPLAVQGSATEDDRRYADLEVVVVRGGRARDADAGGSSPSGAAASTREVGPVVGAAVRVFTESDDRVFALVATSTTGEDGRVVLRLPVGPLWVLAEAPGASRVSRRVEFEVSSDVRLVLSDARAISVQVLDDQGAGIEGATVLVNDADSLPFGGLTANDGIALFERLGVGPYRLRIFAKGFEAAEKLGVVGDVDVVLRKLGGLGVRVVDADGKPVSEAEIYIVGSSLWPARRLETDASGSAELGGLLTGVYDLRARKGSLVSAVQSGVRLERGQRREVELKLGPGRFVRVKVTGEKPLSRPVANASVVLAEFGLSPFPMTARTNVEGLTTIGPLSPGPAFLSVRAKGYVGRGAIPVDDALNEPIHVVSMKGGRLKGRVVDEYGHAIAGARVEVIGLDTDGLPIAETPLLAAYRDAHFDFAMRPLPLIPAGELGVTVGHVPYVNETGESLAGFAELPEDYEPWISDVEGRFSAHPVPPGKVRALVRHPAYVEGLSETVVLGPGGEQEVEVVLSEGGRLLGRVVDERGFPVPNVRVVVAATSGSFERSMQSEADGMFRLAAVPQHVTVSLARPEAPTRFVWKERFDLRAGQEREHEFVLPNPRDALTWRVVDEDDDPIDLAQVTVLSLLPEVPLRQTQFSRENGEVLIDDAAGLSLQVNVRAPGFVPFAEQLSKAPREREIRLVRGVRVAGKVTAVRGHVDVAGARVTVVSEGYKDSTVTNARGSFEFDQVPRGQVIFEVAHDDYAGLRLSTRVEATGRADRAFELDPFDLQEGATLSGTVVDAEGEVVARARVATEFMGSHLSQGSLPLGMVTTDDEGRFKLRGVAPGNVEIFAFSTTRGRGSLQVAVLPGDVLEDLSVELSAYEADEITPDQGGFAVTFGERDDADSVVVVLVAVSPESEAQRAGLQAGDVLVSVDGSRVRSMRAARRATNGRAGTDVVVEVRRHGSEQRFRVRREALSR